MATIQLRIAVLCLAVFCSGAGSLVYQVVWIRKVTGITSATATAAALVVGAFMAGLAVGSRIAGRNQWLLARALPAFAGAEFTAALLAIASIPLLDGSLALLEIGGLRSLGPASIWLPYAVIVLFLLVPTTLLGMSLPLLIAHDELHTGQSRYFVNLVYGTNTLGAVAGCLLAGFVTIEHLGLRGSLWLGAALATTAALMVLPLAQRPGTASAAAPASPPGDPVPPVARSFLLAAFLCGWVALAAEIVWTRLVALIVLNTVYAYTQVLTAVLVGIALGGYGGLLFCRWASAAATRNRLIELSVLLLTIGALLTAAVPVLLTSSALVGEHLPELARGNSLRAALTLGAVLVPPTAAIAFVLPMLILLASDRQRYRAFGDLYAINTWGGVAGSLLAGLLLLPWLGLDWSLALIAMGGILSAAVLCAGHPRPVRAAVFPAAGMIGVLALSAMTTLPQDVYRMRLPPGATVLDFRETALNDSMVVADGSGDRQLWINSSWVAATGGGHLSLGHLPAMLPEGRRQALGIGFGTGQTFAAILDMGLGRLDAVEIDRGVIDLSATWFGDANGDLAGRPDVAVHHDDGRAFLRTTTQAYDLIILEPLQAWSAGTTQLYTRDFYREARRRMAEGAILAQWIPFYGQDAEATRSMVATAIAEFPNASLWLDYRDGILLLGEGDDPPDWRKVESQFSTYTANRGKMGRLDSPEDLLAMFQLGPRALARWTRGARILSDDRPFLEFAAARNIGRDDFLPILESMLPFVEDPAAWMRHDPANAETFARALAIRDTVHQADRNEGSPRYAGVLPLLEAGLRRAPDSGLLRLRYRLGIRSVLPRLGNGTEVEALLQRAIKADPDFAEAMQVLARRYAAQGRMAEARELDRRAMANPRISTSALD